MNPQVRERRIRGFWQLQIFGTLFILSALILATIHGGRLDEWMVPLILFVTIAASNLIIGILILSSTRWAVVDEYGDKTNETEGII